MGQDYDTDAKILTFVPFNDLVTREDQIKI